MLRQADLPEPLVLFELALFGSLILFRWHIIFDKT